MTELMISPSARAQADAQALLAELSGGDNNKLSLGEAWRIVAPLPPNTSEITRSIYQPDTFVDFLKDMAEANPFAKFFPFGLYGINKKTHLNILGRIQAAHNYLKEDPNRKETTSVPMALEKLKDFEAKFSFFLLKHHDEIVSGLAARREECPENEQLDPNELWQAKGTYDVSDKGICRTCYVQKGLIQTPIENAPQQHILATKLKLPFRPSPYARSGLLAKATIFLLGD